MLIVSLTASLLVVSFAGPGAAAETSDLMRGPQAPRPIVAEPPLETSSVTLALTGLIRLYQRRVSPTTPGRCGFSPSCSAYAVAAIRACGPLSGVILTGDRLTRCNLWKGEGAAYTLLPNGLLYDPVANNVPEGACSGR